MPYRAPVFTTASSRDRCWSSLFCLTMPNLRLSYLGLSCLTVGAFLALGIPVANGGVSRGGDRAWAAEWAEIQARGKLIVGVKDNLPPFGFRDAAGNLQGFEIDLARELAKQLLGSADLVELVPLSHRERLSALTDNRVDVAIAQLTVTANRSRLVAFTQPYYTDGTVAIARQGTARAALQHGGAIAVLQGSVAIPLVRQAYPGAVLVAVDSYRDGLRALQAGKVLAFAADGGVLSAWLRQHPEYVPLGERLGSRGIAIALPRGMQYEELRQRTQAVVEMWRKTNWARDRASAWGLP